LGEAHALLGEVPVAVVTPRAGVVDPLDVIAFCRSRLPEHKVPARIVVQDELPKSGAGKIDKRQLRNAICQEPLEVRGK
jgi:acyl-CoA synthetase (AMP-forming)/AMP-acid ligase II